MVIGGDAAGMAGASEVRRRRPEAEIVALEKGSWTSYSACGIPYLVGGGVAGLQQLVARTPQEFRDRRIDMRIEHEVTGIDLDHRTVEVHNHSRSRTFSLGFDLLHVATGATPRRPQVPGINGGNVFGVQTLTDADELLGAAAASSVRTVCVVGSGYIGLELAEAFLQRGAAVTVVDQRPEVMATLDPDMGRLISQAMRDMGITVRLGEELVGVEKGAVTTSGGEIPADLVVLGTGVAPNVALAEQAGLALGSSGAVAVDRRQRTSAEGVYCAGDCCESIHLVSGRGVHVALGTHANKQGRVAGINMAGGYATFPGVMGTAVTKVCAYEIGRTGLGEDEATAAGFEFVTATTTATNRAGYLDEARDVVVKLVAERYSGRLLGAQIVGGPGAAKRIDVLATALLGGLTLDDMIHLDLGYAPPFSPVWDPVLVAVRRCLALLR